MNNNDQSRETLILFSMRGSRTRSICCTRQNKLTGT